MLELGERAGVEIGEVYRVDASRRATALNAYVGGLGPTKRVVLYDNLLDERRTAASAARWSPTSSGTSHGNDISRGIALRRDRRPAGAAVRRSALARRSPGASGAEPGPAGVAARLRARAGGRPRSRSASPATSSRARSRRSADTFALELTDDPQALIDLQQRLAEREPLRSRPARPRHSSCSAPTRRRSSGSARPRLGSEGERPVKVHLITVGQGRRRRSPEADAHYRKLLQRHQPVEVIEVRDEANIEGRIPERAHVVALDRGGRALSSRAGRTGCRSAASTPATSAS